MPCLVTAYEPAPAQPAQDLSHPHFQARLDRLEQIGQSPFTDGQPKHFRKHPHQALITDRMGIAEIRGQGLNRPPKGCPRFQPHRDRRHIGLPTLPTVPPILLDAGDEGLDRGQLDLVIHGMELLLVGVDRRPTLRTPFRLRHYLLVRLRVQRAPAARSSQTGRPAVPLRFAGGSVRLGRLRGWHTGVVGVFGRCLQFGLELRDSRPQLLHLGPQCSQQGILFLARELP